MSENGGKKLRLMEKAKSHCKPKKCGRSKN